MGTLLQLSASSRKRASSQSRGGTQPCQIVIFPGVRIERHALDLSHRIRKPDDRNGFDDGSRRPRQTS
jgi:hypothetical protein